MKSRAIGSVLAMIFLSTAACVVPELHDLGGSGGSGGMSSASVTAGSSSSTAATTSSVTSSTSSGEASICVGTTGAPPAVKCGGTGTVRLQFANVAPSDMAVDFCVAFKNGPPGGSSIADAAKHHAGLPYGEFMAYNLPNASGTATIKAVKAQQSCTLDTELTHVSDVCLVDNDVFNSISFYYLINKDNEGSIVVLRNEHKSDKSLLLRFLNAMPDTAYLDFGPTDNSNLQTTVFTSTASCVAFGQASPKNPTIFGTKVDDLGYLDIAAWPDTDTPPLGWGAAASGTKMALASTDFKSVEANLGRTLTVVAVGYQSGDGQAPDLVGFDEYEDTMGLKSAPTGTQGTIFNVSPLPSPP